MQLWNVGGSVSDDGKTLLITLYDGCNPTNQLFYLDLGEAFTKWVSAEGDATPLRIVRIINHFGTGVLLST